MKWKLGLLVAFVPVVLLAGSDPNQVRGFSANQVYQIGEIDNVNLNNGNLIIRLPIGQTYTVGPSLQYQFMLTYNSKLWDYTFLENDLQNCETSAVGCTLRYAEPDARPNAGLGWSMSLGRLIPSRTTLLQSAHGWIYVGPDGSEHEFPSTTYSDPSEDVTTDSSYLRYKHTGNYREVQFPDGRVAKFESAGNLNDAQGNLLEIRVTEIRDRLGNWVRVNYTDSRWTITDGFGTDTARTHYVDFLDKSSTFTQPNFKRVVSSVKLEVFDRTPNDQTDDVRADYTFSYVDRWVGRGGGGERENGFPSLCLTVPLLETITLPDGTTYTPSYKFVAGSISTTPTVCTNQPSNLNGPMEAESGAITALGLPTHGSIEWTHTTYAMNLQECQTGTGIGYRSYYVGIGSRTYKDANGAGLKKWTYTPTLVQLVGQTMNKSCENHSPQLIPRPAEEFINQVDIWSDVSTGKKLTTKYYFSAYPWGGAEYPNFPHNGFVGEEYGLPFTHNNASPGPRYLSAETFDCTGACQALKRSYVQYEYEVGDLAINARVKSERTLNVATIDGNGQISADTSCSGGCYTDVDRDQWDSFGHYRKSLTTSNITGSWDLTTFVNYTPDSTNWLLEKYTDSWVKQHSVAGDVGARTISDFDSLGILKSQRTLRATGSDPSTLATSGNDLLTVWCRDTTTPGSPGSRGYVTSERHFGGDIAPIPSGDPCAATWTDGFYFLNHGYSFTGAKITGRTSQYAGSPDVAADVDYDWRTGDVRTSRDSAMVATDYVYDSSGRLEQIHPTGKAWTRYTYAPGSTPPKVTVRQCANGVTDCPTSGLTESLYYFDDLGRPLEQRDRTGASEWTAQWMTYDGMGRTKASTTPITVTTSSSGSIPSGTPAASTDYDVLGRVTRVTQPDGSKTIWSYVGDHIKTRTSGIWTGVDGDPASGIQDWPSSVIEEYDGRGRLVAVTEPSGPTTALNPTGSSIRTEYEYDFGDRLATVTMNRSTQGPVQGRIFDYDGRGFLRWESQPESGMTSYLYDARGHAREKNQGAANTLFDLRFVYDKAERLTRIDGRNPLYVPGNPLQPQFRVLKEFVFGDSNNGVDLRLGKLRKGIRYNYASSAMADIYKIEDLYRYRDLPGRLTDRTTTISRIDSFGLSTEVKSLMMWVSYDDLSQVKVTSYPMCVNCGVPPLDPDRQYIQRTYDYGRIKSLISNDQQGHVWSIVDNVSYWPSGLRNVLSHGNGVADTQVVGSMPRPSSIQFGTYDRCVHPTFATQPVSQPLPTNGSVNLSVVMNGTPSFSYQWWNLTDNVSAGTTQSIPISGLTATKSYEVRVSNPCGDAISETAKVTVNECAIPSTGTIQAERQPDGTWILRPNPVSRASRTYAWRRLPSSTVVGTSETLAVEALTATTTFSFTITDECGSAVSNVTIQVPLSMTATGLQATATTPTSVTITWPSVTSGATYHVQSRSGPTWGEIGTTTQLSFIDSTVVASHTYAYRVYAEANGSTSNYSNSDVATTRSFTAPIAGQAINATPSNDMLNAVNSVRAALGWPALTWDNILAANDPVPNPGQSVTARQIASCRSRMNEALQALGVPAQTYTDPDLSLTAIKALHVAEVQERAQ